MELVDRILLGYFVLGMQAIRWVYRCVLGGDFWIFCRVCGGVLPMDAAGISKHFQNCLHDSKER